jgi:hypothetical protein
LCSELSLRIVVAVSRQLFKAQQVLDVAEKSSGAAALCFAVTEERRTPPNAHSANIQCTLPVGYGIIAQFAISNRYQH